MAGALIGFAIALSAVAPASGTQATATARATILKPVKLVGQDIKLDGAVIRPRCVAAMRRRCAMIVYDLP